MWGFCFGEPLEANPGTSKASGFAKQSHAQELAPAYETRK